MDNYTLDPDKKKWENSTPKAKPGPILKSQYFEKTDEWNMLHAFKLTPGRQTIHLNVTMLHINALEPRNPTPDMDEISETRFNEYKYDVLSKLDVI